MFLLHLHYYSAINQKYTILTHFPINNICHLMQYTFFRLLEVCLTLHSTIIYILPKSEGLQASLQNVLLYEQSKCFKVSPEVRLLVMAILLLADI